MSQEFPTPEPSGSDQPTAYEPPVYQPPAPEIPSGAQTYPVPEAPKKDNRRTWTIVAIVLVVLCCCCLLLGVAGYWLYNNGDEIFGISSILRPMLLL